MIPTSVHEIVQRVRAGAVSAEEVVRAYIIRVREVNPRLNAVVLLDEDGALAAARAADAKRARGEALGALHGVPFTVKDSIEVAGMRTTAAAACWRDRIANCDAGVVARLRGAGAILLGKTNLPALSEGFETDNLLFGRTNHPVDPARTPGGSSGGEAALITAGGSPLGLGADAAGSVRIPAHFCGLAALKPTSSRTPIDGHFPAASGSVVERLQFAPMARTTADLAIALRVLVGDDWRDSASLQGPYRDPEAVNLRGLRVAMHIDNGVMPPTPETASAVLRAARALAEAGAIVEEAVPRAIAETPEIMPSLFYGTDGGKGFREYLAAIGMTKLPPLIEASLDRARKHQKSDAEREAVLERWASFRLRMTHFMQTCELVLCPVAAGPAPLHGGTMQVDPMLFFSYSMAFNLTGAPAATVRAGSSPEGLPIGVQLVARPWREDVALAAARTIEAAVGRWPTPLRSAGS
jgi:amidase